ncbi:hypothetical protein OGATHE_001845 [Ogataea polymorpha]|uniref:Uncharacterized protein n=1 Tax=Ogataea polymorpha TaxID=460523 RepID=A0A9P8TCV7_9ASCO|nr:hypothetical protein OGATHE_001845 [Ogataea polymorpha]
MSPAGPDSVYFGSLCNLDNQVHVGMVVVVRSSRNFDVLVGHSDVIGIRVEVLGSGHGDELDGSFVAKCLQSLVNFLGKPRDQQQQNNVEHIVWNREQVDIEGAESRALENQSQVRRDSIDRNVRDQTNEVNRPQVVVHQSGPDHLEGQSLTVVHVALGRVVSEDPIHDDFLLSLGEPSLFVPWLLSLHSTRHHQEPRNNSNGERRKTFHHEKPCPASLARMPTQVEQSVGLESGNNLRQRQTGPEKTQSDGKLAGSEKIGHPQNQVWNEASLENSQKSTTRVETVLALEPELADSDDRPGTHLERNPDVSPQSLGDQLRWQLHTQETQVENGVASVVLVGGEVEVVQQVVRHSLR